MKPLQFHLLLAWVWIWLGFLSGFALGLFFHREDWLGGYASLKRRLYRLCHVSFFGLGVLNLCFYVTAQATGTTMGVALSIASWAFIVGAVFMPLCCLLMAHFPRSRLLFGLPVVSLLVGGALTAFAVGTTGHAGLRATVKSLPGINDAPLSQGFSKDGFQSEKPTTKPRDSTL